MADADHLFMALVLEAVQACSGDIASIESYVLKKMEAMSVEERERVSRDIQRVLGFREPPNPPFKLS